MLHLDRGYDFPFHFQCDFALDNPPLFAVSMPYQPCLRRVG